MTGQASRRVMLVARPRPPAATPVRYAVPLPKGRHRGPPAGRALAAQRRALAVVMAAALTLTLGGMWACLWSVPAGVGASWAGIALAVAQSRAEDRTRPAQEDSR